MVLARAVSTLIVRSASVEMKDQRGDKNLRGEMKAERHFVLNATTGLNTLMCTVLESQDYTKTR